MKGLFGWAIVFTLLVLVIGCGGGGGGGGGSSTGTTGSGTYHAQQVTGYQGSTSNLMIDLRNLVVGDTIQLAITARDSNNNLVVLPASGWRTTAPSGVASVTSGGLLTAVGSSNGSAYPVSVVYGGVTYSANLTVSPLQDFVTGIVRNVSNPIEGALVQFFDATGKQVGTSYSARDGSFRASVPGTTTRFTINLSVVDPTATYYYPQFSYNGDEYLIGTSCLAKLPGTLSSTVPTALLTPIVPDLKSGGPPPPPTGCLG